MSDNTQRYFGAQDPDGSASRGRRFADSDEFDLFEDYPQLDEYDDDFLAAETERLYRRSRQSEGGGPAGTGRPARKPLPAAALVAIDLALIGCALLVFALFHHVIPKELAVVEDDFSSIELPTISSPAASQSDADEGAAVVSETDTADDSPFTDEVIITDTSYSSPNVAVTLTTHDENGVVYYVQDIWLKSVSSLRTAFAHDKYGKGIYEMTPEIAARNNAICAINGDFYGIFATKGIVIRNGTLYRENGTDDDDILVLYTDGSMETFTTYTYDQKELLKRDDIWQAWSFGPSLLTSDGKAIERFDSEVSRANPRTVLGYYEPGHYCFVAVDGRSEDSSGLSLVDLAKLLEDMGCKVAYNLDGGQTSMMTFGSQLVNNPYKGGRRCSDIVYICEPDAQ